MPVPSISRVPFAGRPFSLMGTCGVPTETTSTMRPCSTTTSIGPFRGGSCSVDDGDAADDEAVVGAAAVFGRAVGGGRGSGLGFEMRRGYQDEAEKCNCERSNCLANHLTGASVPHAGNVMQSGLGYRVDFQCVEFG